VAFLKRCENVESFRLKIVTAILTFKSNVQKADAKWIG